MDLQHVGGNEGGREGMFDHGQIRTFVACLSSFKNVNKVNALATTQPTIANKLLQWQETPLGGGEGVVWAFAS